MNFQQAITDVKFLTSEVCINLPNFPTKVLLSILFTCTSCFKLNNFHHVDATIFFNESTYSVNEYDGSAQFVLVLSNPVSTAFTVVVETDSAATAIGDWANICIGILKVLA